MLKNPFTPSTIASEPTEFFGRRQETKALERALAQGCVVIQGPVGIGKSSLLAHSRLVMEGFGSQHKCKTFMAVGDKSVKDIDAAARLVLESFVKVDQKKKRVKFSFPKVVEFESEEICTYFATNRHLAALKRILEAENLKAVLTDSAFLVICIDEVDKCPVAVAQLVRSVVTHTQQNNANRVRFILAGVSPFYQAMIAEDSGLTRFVQKVITLEPFEEAEAAELVHAKMTALVEQSKSNKTPLRIDDRIVERLLMLSGGHPHILQLLGSQLVEHENDDPDNLLDARDLVGSLQKICYEDRRPVYDSLIHDLEFRGILEGLFGMLQQASPSFPTRIDRTTATAHLAQETLQWLIDSNILYVVDEVTYGLTDEFFRIRLTLDRLDALDKHSTLELNLLRLGTLDPEAFEEYSDD